jgi:hypothetical protein
VPVFEKGGEKEKSKEGKLLQFLITINTMYGNGGFVLCCMHGLL